MSWMQALGAGGSMLGGFAGQQLRNSSTRGSTTANSQTTPTYSGEQASLQGSLMSRLNQTLTDPMSAVKPMQTAATDSINKTYDGLSGRMQKFLAGRGFAQSGTMGTNQQQLELSRAGDIATSNNNMAGLALNNQQNSLADALKFAFSNPGSSSMSSGSGSSATNYGNAGDGILAGLSQFLGQLTGPALAGAGG